MATSSADRDQGYEINQLKLDVLEIDRQLEEIKSALRTIVEVIGGQETEQGGEVEVAIRDALKDSPTIEGASFTGGSAVNLQVTAIHDSAQDDRVVSFSPGSANPVNFWIMMGSGTTDPVTLQADGTDTDVGISFIPKGAGVVMEGLVPLALGAGDAPPSTAAVTDAPTKAVLDALIVLLQSARIAS